MEKIENLDIEGFIEAIKGNHELLEEYYQTKSKRDHSDYCRYNLCINEKEKVIYISEDNQTGFAKGFEDNSFLIKTGNWMIKVDIFHAKNNLWCPGFCEILKSHREKAFLKPFTEDLTILEVN